METIYTFGYSGQQPATLRRHGERLNALLIDVRLKAWSQQPTWRPAALRELVGDDTYLHMPELGNLNYKTGGPIQLANPEAVVEQVRTILTTRPVILLCGCANVLKCHRRMAALYLKKACGAPVCLTLPPLEPGQGIWKVLTLTQPWATLVALGAKRIETRFWPTSYRGPLLIHAAKGLAGMGERAFRELCQQEPFVSALAAGGYHAPNDLPRGALVAACHLADVQPITLFTLPDEPERSFGNYEPGRFAWRLEQVHRLPVPQPATGAQGLWEWAGVLPLERAA